MLQTRDVKDLKMEEAEGSEDGGDDEADGP